MNDMLMVTAFVITDDLMYALCYRSHPLAEKFFVWRLHRNCTATGIPVAFDLLCLPPRPDIDP